MRTYNNVIRKILSADLTRFLLGGGVTVFFEYAVFYILYVFTGWGLLVSNSASFGVGLGISFIFNRLWAFRKRSYRRKAHHQAGLYVLLALTNLLLNNVIVASLKVIGLDPRIGKIVAIVFIATWNYVIYKRVIFSESEARI